MDVGTAMSVAQTLFAALQCSQLNEICSTADYKSKLNELRQTVERIKVVLKDAEAKQELSDQEQLYIEELKDTVYEADDLFDEFVTLAERKQLTKGIKVRVLSLFTKFGTAYDMTQGVKKIKSKLDAIAFDKRFNLSIDPKPIKNRRLETCSYVHEADIIGRETDLEKIVGVLLDSNVQHDVSFLSIVGIGGLGKTALAQLVYSDARVTTAFSLKLWTCVADENQELLDVRGVLDNILASATGYKMNEACTMDELQRKLRKKLLGEKYLLVLDDVWTENYERWHTLKQYLMGCQKGSWIVVTTRSHRTAEIIGDGVRHELKGLSKEDSLCLFKRVAFGSQHSNPPEDLVKISEHIVEECANVPLAIRVVGSLLYGQEKNKWLSIWKLGLAKVKESQISIMPILKLSYYKLESALKSCFSYCAIFPKDYVMEKDTLIRLWMAQGYIPFNDPQSPEDLAEEYFLILLRRCFFQDVKKDKDGNIMSCKVHDLMHDVAQEVVGNEICTVKSMNGNVNKKIRHISIVESKFTTYTYNKTCISSFLHFEQSSYGVLKRGEQLCVDALVANWRYLRALDLSRLGIKCLADSICDLIHLRYLDLSYNEGLEVLPRSFKKLGNLQTLILLECRSLRVLPEDLYKLAKLRVLDLTSCYSLRYMPRGMGKLSCLHTLGLFVLGGASSSKGELFHGVEDLRALRNLKGFLDVRIRLTKPSATGYKGIGGREGGCLENKEYLQKVEFHFGGQKEGREEHDEAAMEVLQPHLNLKSLWVSEYQGLRMPSWARKDNIFLNLVEIIFYNCPKLQKLGLLWLPQLKKLGVFYCPNLKLGNFNDRLEIIPTSGASSSSSSYAVGPKLREVIIDNVALLNSLSMKLFDDGAKLVINMDSNLGSVGEAREVFCSCSSSWKDLEILFCYNVNNLIIDGLFGEPSAAFQVLRILEAFKFSESEEVEPEYSFCQSLHSLKFKFLYSMVNLPNWIQYLTALQTLTIDSCDRLESMPKWMPKLTSLRELRLIACSGHLEKRCQQSTGEDWPLIQHIPNIVIKSHLSMGITDQFFQSLQQLREGLIPHSMRPISGLPGQYVTYF